MGKGKSLMRIEFHSFLALAVTAIICSFILIIMFLISKMIIEYFQQYPLCHQSFQHILLHTPYPHNHSKEL